MPGTTFILRQNNDAFLDYNWTPLIGTKADNVFVNKWSAGDKTVYTVLNMKAEGVNGQLFPVVKREGRHWVSLWNHENLEPLLENGISFVPARASGWHSSWSGTRKEGSVDCIAEFPVLLKPVLAGDSLLINATGKRLLIWKGNPSYTLQPKELKLKNDTVVKIRDFFGFYEGKIVLQLLDREVLKDECIIELPGGKPWLISKITRTVRATSVPDNMTLVPGASLFV